MAQTIANSGNMNVYLFVSDFRKKLKQKSFESPNAKKWAFNFKNYCSKIFSSFVIINFGNIWVRMKEAPGWGSWVYGIVFKAWFNGDYQDDQAIFDNFYEKLKKFDNQKAKKRSQPNASQVAASTNPSNASVHVRRVRRGGQYKNSVTPQKLSIICRASLLTTKAGKYVYVSIGLLSAYKNGGIYITSNGLEAGEFCTNANINKVCRKLFSDWNQRSDYSPDAKWKGFYQEATKGSGWRVFNTEQYTDVYNNIVGFTQEHLETFRHCSNVGFVFEQEQKEDEDENNDGGYEHDADGHDNVNRGNNHNGRYQASRASLNMSSNNRHQPY
eukprot:384515_1